MAEKSEKPSEKTIEMRLAEIEDKLSQLHITEEEMKTYQKVAAALGQARGVPGAAPGVISPISPISPIINRGITPIRYVCTCICPCGPCYECTCGPCGCIAGGGGSFGGGFGGFGT
jgi:hypothetical protein